MKASQAIRLTYGFDPAGWLAYSDFLTDQNDADAKAALWRCRGETALAVLRWLESYFHPLIAGNGLSVAEAREIALSYGCYLRPRLTKKLLFLPLWHHSVRDLGAEFRAANPDSTAVVLGTQTDDVCLDHWQLLKTHLRNDKYMKRRLVEMADRVLGRA